MNIIQIKPSRLDEYASIPISFEVSSVFEVLLIDHGLGGMRLEEQMISPYEKDYDFYEPPSSWPVKFDISNWGIFLAEENNRIVGGAAVAWDPEGLELLDGRKDISMLWDLRVTSNMRRRGIGRKLFEYAAGWSKSKNCAQMKIETQNTNINACRFYSAMGAELGDIRRFAYEGQGAVSKEVQLNWYLHLR